MKSIILFFTAAVLTGSCGKNKTTSPAPNTEDTVTLKSTAAFNIGCAINSQMLNGVVSYRNTVKKEFNAITPENDAKLSSIHPTENTWNYGPMDAMVSFAQANNIKVHGHVLVWHTSQGTGWLENYTGDSATLEGIFKNHIQTLVTKYKGKIKSWDVVNEAFNDDGSYRIINTSPAGQGTNGSLWAQKLGTDYIARAFQYAHQADPDALLFFNEYDLETRPAKLAATINLVNNLKARGIPIHGIGTQCHMPLNISNDKIANSFRQLAATGLKIHLSELDILVSNFDFDATNNANRTYPETVQTEHAAKYKFVAQAYKTEVPLAQRWGITTWGVNDTSSWITAFLRLKDWPLLFDEQYKRKKTYFGFRDGLKN